MKLKLKDYKTLKTKKYLKTNNIYIYVNGINKNSISFIKTKQEFKNMNFDYYQIFNKTSIKILENSIYKNNKTIINGVTFLIKPINNKLISKKVIFHNIKNLMFVFLTIKLNNKIYILNQFKKVSTLNYYKNKLLLYQFGITYLKSYL